MQTKNKIQSYSKLKIAIKSYYLINILITACILAVLIFGIVSFLRMETDIGNLLSLIMLSLCLGFLIPFINNIIVLVKIFTGKYSEQVKRIRSIQTKRIFDSGNKADKVLVFNDIRLTIDCHRLNNFQVGDKVYMIFLEGIAYPIVMEVLK